MTRSEEMLVRCGSELSAAVHHPLLRDMTAGRISTGAFLRYAALEAGFVETARRLAERARDVEEDAGVHAVLEGIVTDLAGPQGDYFRMLLDEDPAARRQTDPLTAYVETLAESHGAAAIAVCFAAAETLYATWCAAAARRMRARPQAVQVWIDMHATSTFAAQAAFWRSLIDRLPADIDDATLDAWFIGALAAEDRFHDAAYQESAA